MPTADVDQGRIGTSSLFDDRQWHDQLDCLASLPVLGQTPKCCSIKQPVESVTLRMLSVLQLGVMARKGLCNLKDKALAPRIANFALEARLSGGDPLPIPNILVAFKVPEIPAL